MMKSLVAVVAIGALLAGCGRAPDYTVRQGVADIYTYEHVIPTFDPKFVSCVVTYMFHRLPPIQVKALIQGADLAGYSPPVVTKAQFYCSGSPTPSKPGKSGVAPSSASLDHPSKGSVPHPTTVP